MFIRLIERIKSCTVIEDLKAFLSHQDTGVVLKYKTHQSLGKMNLHF